MVENLLSSGVSHFASVCFLPGVWTIIDHFNACPRAARNTAKPRAKRGTKSYSVIVAGEEDIAPPAQAAGAGEHHHSHLREGTQDGENLGIIGQQSKNVTTLYRWPIKRSRVRKAGCRWLT